MPEVPSSIPSLHRDLHDIYGARLQSIVAHGLGARESSSAHAGHADHEPRVETLVVVDTLGADDLRACAARVGSWHDAGLATPLVLAANEFARALDAFPLEFGAILADHVVVWGRSPFDGLSVDPADLRRACEVQARGHLLHLREGYLETRGRGDALAVLIVQSAPAFAALLRSIARLQGVTAADRGAVARHAERLLGVSGGIEHVVRLADVTEIASEEATRMFPSYLEAVSRLVEYVDGWSTSR
jgi:hypothetical protein